MLELNRDLETMLICAIRYSVGRLTYMPMLVINYITPLIPQLSGWCLWTIIADFKDISNYGEDKNAWEEFISKVKTEYISRGFDIKEYRSEKQ